MHLKAVVEEKHLSQRKPDGARKAAIKEAQNSVKVVAYMHWLVELHVKPG